MPESNQFVLLPQQVQAFRISNLFAHPMDPSRVVLECGSRPPFLIAADSRYSCDNFHPPVPGCWLVLFPHGEVDIFTPDQFHDRFVEGELNETNNVTQNPETRH